MLNSDELEFFEENKDKIYDLIRAVDQHENIRAIVGPGNVMDHPHLVLDYFRAHDVMSRLSQYLHGEALLGLNSAGPLDDHKDAPQRFSFNPLIRGSC